LKGSLTEPFLLYYLGGYALELKGQIESIVFYNEENGYAVCNLDVNSELITAVGTMPFISVGDIIKAEGTLVKHAVYGEQLKVNSFEKIMPSSSMEVEKYLGSGIIKGVGPATAKKIVSRFGEDTVDVIRFTPYELSSISGITSSKALQISEEFNKEWQLWQIVIFLQKYDIGATNSSRVYKELGYTAIDKIKDNPYILLDILYGVSFETIDRMAISLGIDYNSSFRVTSGLKYALGISAKNGNTCSSKDDLISYVSTILKVPQDLVENELTKMTYSKELYIEDGYVFINNYFEAEDSIARKVMELCNDRVKKCINIDAKIVDIEKKIGITLSKEQKNAVKMAFDNKICIITGGPGTRKNNYYQDNFKFVRIRKTGCSTLCTYW
jgi:exodeoxyribonuclease V alpha subunit